MKQFVTRCRLTIPLALIAALFFALAGSPALSAQTPAASPEASPETVILPDGPLGDHIQWLLEIANAGAGTITIDQINEHFSPDFFADTTMSELFSTLADLQSAGVNYEIDPDSVITTRDLPASNGRFILIASDDSITEVSLQIDHESGLIVGLSIQSATDATPSASPAA